MNIKTFEYYYFYFYFFCRKEINKINISKLKIENIENIVYIGDIVKYPNLKRKWKMIYKCDKITQMKENGRIYLIIIDNEIYKIGSSESKGGIKNTLSSYEFGLGGSPSLRTFGIHLLIQEQLDMNKEIKIYALFVEPIKLKMQGFSTMIEKITFPKIKDMEELCREDYKKVYKKYPNWNFQENNQQFPEHIKLKFKNQVNNRNIN